MSSKKLKKAKPEYSFLGIKIEKFDVIADASINYEVRSNLRECSGDERIYSFGTQVEITGICNYPEECVGVPYTITIYGDDRRQDQFNMRLKDCHAIDDKWQKIYRKVKDEMRPVYNVPKGIGYLEKTRASEAWSGYIWVAPRYASDVLTLLNIDRPLYIEIHRLKEGRGYTISGLSLKTIDPRES